MSWTFTDTTPPELICSFRPACLFCGATTVVTGASLYKVQMTGVNDPDPQGRAIDVNTKCPKCFYVEAFGVAISQEEAEKIYGK